MMRLNVFSRCATAAIACAVACTPTGDPAPNGAAQSGGVVREDVAYTATTRIMESFPVQLHTTVTLHNRGSQRTSLQFPDGCTVLLRVFRTASREQRVWDQAGILACTQALQTIELGPGERRELAARSDARQVLGDSLANGRYFLVAYLRVNGDVIEIDAGAADLAVPR